MVAFDNTILSILLFPDAEVHAGSHGEAVERAQERVDALVQQIAAAGEQVLIPTPALAEVLSTPGCDMDEVLNRLRTLRISASVISISGPPLNLRFVCGQQWALEIFERA